MEETARSSNDGRPNDSLVQTNSMLRLKLDEEHANYKRKLQAYQDGQQRQAQLIQKLQSKVSVRPSTMSVPVLHVSTITLCQYHPSMSVPSLYVSTIPQKEQRPRE